MIKTFLSTNRTRIYWVAVLLILLSVGAGVWYKNIYTDKRRVFEAMLVNSWRTESVVKQIIQDEEGQSSTQFIRLQAGEQHIAQSLNVIEQTGGGTSAKVATESIGTPTLDFVRYRAIETNQKSMSGKDLDFSRIVGVWGKSETNEKTAGELYNQAALGIIPFGNLSAENREKLLKIAIGQDVYKVAFANVKVGSVNGRPAYEYKVKVLPQDYVILLKEYAKMVGLTQLENINPAAYENADPVEFSVVVDVRTRRITSLIYESGRQENFTAYGSNVTVAIPKDTVSVEELQSRLQQLQ